MAYFGTRYFGNGSSSGGTGATPGDIWSYVIEGGYTAGDILRILAAVAAGKTHIVKTGPHRATVTFDAIDESGTVVSAEMDRSERTDVTLTP